MFSVKHYFSQSFLVLFDLVKKVLERSVISNWLDHVVLCRDILKYIFYVISVSCIMGSTPRDRVDKHWTQNIHFIYI